MKLQGVGSSNWWLLSPELPKGSPASHKGLIQREVTSVLRGREGKEEEQSLLASPGGGVCVCGGAICKQPGTGKWEQLLMCVCVCVCVGGGSLGNLAMWLVQPS